MKSIKHIIALVLILSTTAFAQDSKPEERFKFKAGYPTPDASQALYDEMDYQRAVQAPLEQPPTMPGANRYCACFGALIGT